MPTNKELVTEAMNALAKGDTKPFGALMDDDFRWTIGGSTSWSGTYDGVESVRRDLLVPLFDQFTTTYTNRPVNILADGDFVVVECCGYAMAKSGIPYDNKYCYVIRMKEGKMKTLVEYMDTELVSRALETRSAP